MKKKTANSLRYSANIKIAQLKGKSIITMNNEMNSR